MDVHYGTSDDTRVWESKRIFFLFKVKLKCDFITLSGCHGSFSERMEVFDLLYLGSWSAG